MTLRDAATYITKPHDTEWQAAMEAPILVADLGGPTMFARIGMLDFLPNKGLVSRGVSHFVHANSQAIPVSRIRNNASSCKNTAAPVLKHRQIAISLAALHSSGRRVVAIVSAMGRTTDELAKLAYQVSPHLNRRESTF